MRKSTKNAAFVIMLSVAAIGVGMVASPAQTKQVQKTATEVSESIHEMQAEERIYDLLLKRVDDAANTIIDICCVEFPENYAYCLDDDLYDELLMGDASVDTKVKAIEQMDREAGLSDGIDQEYIDFYYALEELDRFIKLTGRY